MADFLNNLHDQVKKHDVEEPEDLGQLRSVQMRQFYYKKLKIKAAMEDQKIVDLVQKAVKHALEDGTI